jgi:outer membrane protein assembly factor BamB
MRIKSLAAMLILLYAAIQAPLAHAQVGLEYQPYWMYRTEAPVVDVGTGDINGDGTPEVVIGTTDGVVYVLENDGDLAWRYEAGFVPTGLLVDEMDDDASAAEIVVFGENQQTLLSESERPLWTPAIGFGTIVHQAITVDLNGDGRVEVVEGLASGSIQVFNMANGRLINEHGLDDRYFKTGQPVVDLWAGDIDGDGLPEILPSLAGDRIVYVLEDDLMPLWTQPIEAEVGLVQGGDVDGDGQAEVVVLGTAWDLFLLESDGSQVWHSVSLSRPNALRDPVPGQLIVHDLDGDDEMEIVVVTPGPLAAVRVFDGDGHEVWKQSLEAVSMALKLIVGDPNADGAVELVATTEGQAQVYLLTASGHLLAEYHLSALPADRVETTGALAYADLNGDGWGEIIVGADTGVQVFGTSDRVVWQELWQSPRLGFVTALFFSDLDGNGRGEVIAGEEDGGVDVLADKGRILWNAETKIWGEGIWRKSSVGIADVVWALSAGDVDADGRGEVVVGTQLGQIHLVADGQLSWTVPSEKAPVNSLAVRDLDGDGQAEIVVGSGQGSGLVALLDGQGDLIWRKEFDNPVIAVGTDGGLVLAATEGGRVYRLTATGSLIGEHDLGAEVLSLDAGLMATADGRLYQWDDGGLSVAHDVERALRTANVNAQLPAILTQEQEVGLLVGDQLIWKGAVVDNAFKIAAGDLNGDGEAEFAAAIEERVHAFGLALDQPPMLTGPDLTETRTGYVYSVNVNDPEGDAVPITLEIWDPSARKWLSQPAQSLGEDRDRGRLSWEVVEPFDTWDSGRESRFRFSYSDGDLEGALKEISGPLTIPTTPWYGYYGQRVGLGVLILLVPALGLLLYRRQRAYRCSLVGQAEMLLKALQANWAEAPLNLHGVARDEAALLAYLPGLAREAEQLTLADLGEGFNMIVTRPEVAGEGLRLILGGIDSLNGLQGERATVLFSTYELFQDMLQANTVSRIVALRPQLADVEETLTGTVVVLGEAAGALTDLGGVADALRNYQRVDLVEDKVAYLAQAIESLGRLDREFRVDLPQPERNILGRIALNWLNVSTNTLQDLQGRAQLEVSLKTRQLADYEKAVLSLELTNTGRSPASNIVVDLLPGQGYAPRDGDTARLGLLPASRSEVVELPVSVTPSVEQFRAEFRITFDDRERSGKTLAFADVVRLLQPAAEFRPIFNPYAPGTPLAPGSPIFFGRDDLFDFIQENMAGLARQNVLVLIGQRRMGKTSFLQQLPARLGEEYFPVYLDGQSLGVDPGMANFFYDVALAISDALADQGVALAEPKPEEFYERPSGAFERTFLPAVLGAIGRRQLLLLFDEFEELEMRVAAEKLEPTIFPFLRHLMQHGGNLGFIFVGTHRLEALSSDYWSIFFNIALYKHVAFLDEGAARRLIVEPVAEGGLRYDDLALDKMLRVTAGHPYFLQLTCHALVNHANRGARGYLTIQDVNDVLEEMVELGEAHFAFLWEQSSPPERLALASLTHLLGHQPTVTGSQVAELLAERGAAIELPGVTETLRRLVERDILREVRGQPPRYEYKVELVRLWIERYNPLGRVVDEVG